jgi:hypothetical protein
MQPLEGFNADNYFADLETSLVGGRRQKSKNSLQSGCS